MTTPAPAPSRFNAAAILSVVETVCFIIAVILAIWFNKSDAVDLALIGASAHALNHRAGGSPI